MLVALAAVSPASAQAPAGSRALEPRERVELAAIDAESRTASDVYFTSLGLVIGGGVLAGAGVGMMAARFSLSSSSDPVGLVGFFAATIGGGLAGLAILLLLPIAIVLDVDSGSRRGGLEARARARPALGAALRVTGGPGDVGIGLALAL